LHVSAAFAGEFLCFDADALSKIVGGASFFGGPPPVAVR